MEGATDYMSALFSTTGRLISSTTRVCLTMFSLAAVVGRITWHDRYDSSTSGGGGTLSDSRCCCRLLNSRLTSGIMLISNGAIYVNVLRICGLNLGESGEISIWMQFATSDSSFKILTWISKSFSFSLSV